MAAAARAALENTLPMLALGTAFAIVVGILRGGRGVAAGHSLDRASMLARGGVLLDAHPVAGADAIVVLSQASCPRGGSDPFLELTNPGWFAALEDALRHMLLPSLTLGARASTASTR